METPACSRSRSNEAYFNFGFPISDFQSGPPDVGRAAANRSSPREERHRDSILTGLNLAQPFMTGQTGNHQPQEYRRDERKCLPSLVTSLPAKDSAPMFAFGHGKAKARDGQGKERGGHNRQF